MALQQNRILRFLMVLTAVLLTIFIYASYYSSTILTLPARFHSSSSAPAVLKVVDAGNANTIIVVDRQNSGAHHTATGNQLNDTTYSRIHNNENTSSIVSSTLIISSLEGSTNQRIIPYAVLNGTINGSPSNAGAVPLISPAYSRTKGSNRVNPLIKYQSDPLKGVQTRNIYESGYESNATQICPDKGKDIKLIILVTSAPKNQEARLAIRQTWGHYNMRRDIAIGFALGRTINQQIEELIQAENNLYGDMIRGNFVDSYNNLTLKTISILEWVDQMCPKASFLLKTDDDMFINVPKLLAFINKHKSDKRMIYGRLAKKWKPIRNQKSKYYVSPAQFSSGVFPQFTTGPAYLITSDVIRELFSKSLEQTYLKLEDVFTTGIVAQLLNIRRIHVNEFLNRRIAFNPCNIRKAISIHMVKNNEQFDLWKKLLDVSAKCK